MNQKVKRIKALLRWRYFHRTQISGHWVNFKQCWGFASVAISGAVKKIIAVMQTTRTLMCRNGVNRRLPGAAASINAPHPSPPSSRSNGAMACDTCALHRNGIFWVMGLSSPLHGRKLESIDCSTLNGCLAINFERHCLQPRLRIFHRQESGFKRTLTGLHLIGASSACEYRWRHCAAGK